MSIHVFPISPLFFPISMASYLVHLLESVNDTLRLHIADLNTILKSLEGNFRFALEEHLERRCFTGFHTLKVNRGEYHLVSRDGIPPAGTDGEWYNTLAIPTINESFAGVLSIIPILREFPLKYATYLNAGIKNNSRSQIGVVITNIRRKAIRLFHHYQSLSAWKVVLESVRLHHPQLHYPKFVEFCVLSHEHRCKSIHTICTITRCLVDEWVEGSGEQIKPTFDNPNVGNLLFDKNRWDKDQVLSVLTTFRSWLRGVDFTNTLI